MLIHRINVFFLSLIIVLSQTFIFINTSHATQSAPQDRWDIVASSRDGDDFKALLKKTHKIRSGADDYARAEEFRKFIARVDDRPTSSKVGSVTYQRIGAGSAIVGVVAVTSLLEAIDWVMEDGTYVKYKQAEPYIAPPNKIWTWSGCGTAQSCVDVGYADKDPYEVCRTYGSRHPSNLQTDTFTKTTETTGQCTYKNSTIKQNLKTQDYQDVEPTKPQKIPLTSDLLGDLMMGDYTDPVDNQYDKKDHIWTGVEGAYQYDPNGVGNELNNDLQNKANDATNNPKPKAPDGNPMDEPAPQAWDITDQQGQGQSETKPTLDPETGEPTGGDSTEFQLPPFCSWAFIVCDWYEDWTESDKKVQEHLKKTQEHQQEEKTFWQKVTDFFDWAKDESEIPDKDEEELEDEQEPALNPVDVHWGAQCPEKETFTFELEGYSQEISIINFEYVCQYAHIIKPVVIFGATLEGIFILAGIRRNGATENE